MKRSALGMLCVALFKDVYVYVVDSDSGTQWKRFTKLSR